MKSKPTIKDVASLAGVSIATVSHVINKTRYVKPELVEKVNDAIINSGYGKKLEKNKQNIAQYKGSYINLVLPHITNTINIQIASSLNKFFSGKGFHLSIHITNNNLEQEKIILNKLSSDKNSAGIILVPLQENPKLYKNIIKSPVPFVCIEKKIDHPEVYSVTSSNYKATYLSTNHLIKRHHNTIVLLIPNEEQSVISDRLEGYKKALEENNIYYRSTLVIEFDPEWNEERIDHEIQIAYEKLQPSACIACGNNLTLSLLRSLQIMGKECPRDLSIIGFGDNPWCEIATPPMTMIRHNTEEMTSVAGKMLENLINGKNYYPKQIEVDMELLIRKSTRMISQGPFGYNAVTPEEIIITEKEKQRLKEGRFRVAISFHYSGTAWTRLHEIAIRNTLEKYSVSVVSVMDAQFDPSLQLAQLEAIKLQKPDAIIAIPTDDHLTARKFKELSKTINLVFISNIPEGLKGEEYVSCVTVNEKENGSNAGILMGDYLKKHTNPKVGFIIHGTSFYGTQARDTAAEKTIRENYKNIDIVAIESFGKIDHAYSTCKELVKKHPDIEALYISWDQPALAAIKALEEIERTDIAIFTFDLDYNIASYMARKKMVMGLSTQKPYEQGVATALAAAKSLVSRSSYKYIAVQPYSIKPKQLLKAWKDIMHEPIPPKLEKLVKTNLLS